MWPETKSRNQFLLLRMMFSNENNYILFCKRAFPEVLEGVAMEIFSGGEPHFPTAYLLDRVD